ncbi:MAG: ATP-binding protein [Clostridiales bacterium]|jgi:predicted AAA+ superfamily ATPase|nr:ATP-binding protein [Clostridiales bacterium]
MQEELLVFDLNDLLGEEVFGLPGFLTRLFSFAEEYGISGNVWQHYIVYRLLLDENPYSLRAELGRTTGTLAALARRDIEVIADYFDPEFLENNCPIAAEIAAYTPMSPAGSLMAKRVRNLTGILAGLGRPAEFLDALTEEYALRGAGQMGAFDAFTFLAEGGKASLHPVPAVDRRGLGHLVGYERQKDELIANTAAFLKGRGGNDVLLYGDAGTGKSSAVKALINVFPGKKLKLIEVNRDRYRDIPLLLDMLAPRGFFCILFLDDLSFEESETDYKYLKAFLEGGLRRRPPHIAVYATSNRGHLVAEQFSDRQDMTYTGDVHRSETLEEKLSLAARFGLKVFFPAPDGEAFLEIARSLRDRAGLALSDERLESLLKQWQLAGGRRSGRMAEQFIRALAAETPAEQEQ